LSKKFTKYHLIWSFKMTILYDMEHLKKSTLASDEGVGDILDQMGDTKMIGGFPIPLSDKTVDTPSTLKETMSLNWKW